MKRRKSFVIALDFDGTTVTDMYPNIGIDVYSSPVLKEIVNNGHRIVLNTMRSGKELQDAVNWFQERSIPLYGINNNPTQHEWTDSSKVHADTYIDDRGLGTPLLTIDPYGTFVDWGEVKVMLKKIGVI